MLLSHRHLHVAALGAWIDTHAIVHSRYRVHVVERRRVVSEDALMLRAFHRCGHLARPVMTVLLEGRARIRACGKERWLEPGDVSVLGAKTDVAMRQDGERGFLSLAIEWDPGSLSTARQEDFSTSTLDSRVLAALTHAARSLASAGDAEVASAAKTVERVIATLRSAGAPFDAVDAGALIEPVSPTMRRLGRALDDSLSRLDGRPMSIDLEAALGLSARQVNRLVSAFNARYGFNAAGWRDTRVRRQLLMGATLMTAPGATAERVASAVGYGSTRAFYHALTEAGLPQPSAIRDAVRDLS